ncbi:hypothetical protein KP509_03G021400 [Ceratopteris richardii]|uniref:Uncharacterized protein n=1 Tax=Ceratopteris richardii TaxID=49495 RepID=A0A8T2UXZ1_CERRI|nr:hypothetical protein KP509_03G021400 [Ceratopteris richardii]
MQNSHLKNSDRHRVKKPRQIPSKTKTNPEQLRKVGLAHSMPTDKELREARRQRILARGSDRLAYITGDKSKQNSPRASPVLAPHEVSSFSTQTSAEESRSASAVARIVEVTRSGSDEGRMVQELNQHEANLKLPEVSEETSGEVISTSDRQSVKEPIVRTSLAPVMSNELSQAVKPPKRTDTVYVRIIIESIEASESLRASMAAIVAILVALQSVLSHCGHSWGNVIAILLPLWPLCLVCITDLVLVTGAYILHTQKKLLKRDLYISSANDLDGSFGKFSKALEVVGQLNDVLSIGLLLKKVVAAIFLDCSIYVVALICSFSVCDYTFSFC